MLDGVRFEDIQEKHLQQLIDNGVREGMRLEYKRETYGRSDADKKEFLKDISSFSNRSGGHLIIGMNEEDGVADSIVAIPESEIDQELQRLESLARDSIEPRIPSINFRSVPVRDGAVILARIDASWALPHRTAFKNSNRFFGRNSSGAYELSMDEIRSLFVSGQMLTQRAEKFIQARLKRLPSDGSMTPINTGGRGVLVIHLAPLNSIAINQIFDPNAVDHHRDDFRPIDSEGHSRRHNLYGLLVYQGGESCTGYTQVFRNGYIEAIAVGATFERKNEEGEMERYIHGKTIAEWLIDGISSYMEGLRNIDASPPVLISIALLGVYRTKLGTDQRQNYRRHPQYPDDNLVLPSFLLPAFAGREDYARELSKILDILWNAFNYSRCDLFNANRQWIDP